MSIALSNFYYMFWENFYNLCQNRGLTPNKVAKSLEFSNATVTVWKKGSYPTSDKLLKIAEFFGVSTDYLLGRSRADPELPEDERRLLNNYRRADERGKKRIQNAAAEEAEEQDPKQNNMVS